LSIPVQILLAFGSVAVLLALMAIVQKLSKTVGLNAEIQRKLVHIGTGLYALTLPWLFPSRWPVYMLIAITLVVMLVLRMPRLSKAGLGATLHGVDRKSYGDLLLATLADAAAALVGTIYGTKLYKVEDSHKSVEGSVVFFIVTLLIALICFMLFSEVPTLNILVLSLMVAAFGTLVEAQSWRGFDNLFLPLGLLVFISKHADGTLVELLVLTGVFWITVVNFRILGPKFGLTAHAARVYVIVLFLLLSVTAMQNAVLPILVLATHAWCRITNPCHAKFPELDIVASLMMFSIGWLILGNATGWNAVSFYGISAMGLAMGLSVTALAPAGIVVRFLGIGGIAVALYFIRQGVSALNPAASNWAEPLNALALFVLVLITVIPLFYARMFQHNRVIKLTLLSVSISLGYYLFSMSQHGVSA